MKPRRKIIIIAAAGIFVLLLAVGGGALWLINNQNKQMSPLGNQEVIPGIYAVRNDIVNIYLIQSGDKYIAIDAGMNEAQTREGLDVLGISSDDIIAVLLTHTHFDHIGALSIFDNATVYASPDAKPNMADQTVSDGMVFTIGKEFQVISTPGHADDSVCYLYDGKYLFTGDNLSLKDNKVGLFNSLYNNSDERQKADIRKLAGLTGVEYVFTAHYGYTDKADFRIILKGDL